MIEFWFIVDKFKIKVLANIVLILLDIYLSTEIVKKTSLFNHINSIDYDKYTK